MTPETDSRLLLDGAIAAATTAGNHARDNRHRSRDAVQRAQHDVKLQLDMECQQVALSTIADRFPDHTILGEEDALLERGIQGADSGSLAWETEGYLWIVDPIDGTVNFTHGLRQWCCSVAVWKDGAAVAGAVYAPELDELYAATSTTAATLNGKPLAVSATDDTTQAMVMAGLDNVGMGNEPPLAILTRLALQTQRPRAMGCAALDCCQVACGRADGYFESAIHVWDVAAAGLIVTRAGGHASILWRHDRTRLGYLTSNARLHDRLRAIIAPQ